MKRGEPLKRTTPLKATTGLRRSTPMQQKAGREQPEARKSASRKARRRSTKGLVAQLTVRSGGLCEMQLKGCQGRAVDPCHRIGTKAGGRQGAAAIHHDRLSNAVHGCRACHDWQTATGNRLPAEEYGLVLREGADTENTKVLLRCEWFYLYDDGTKTEALG